MKDPWILITPPPTPNGRLHIGHMAGPFLKADLLKRLIGFVSSEDVFHVSHVDTYQSYVPKKARELKRDVFSFRKEMASGIREDFTSFGIDFDMVIDNTSEEYLRFLESAIRHLVGRVQTNDLPTLCCTNCHHPLFEAHVKGFCKHCFHDCYQNVCENCCRPQSRTTQLNRTCGDCGGHESVASDSHTESWLRITDTQIKEALEHIHPLCSDNRRLMSLFEGLAPHEIALTYSSDYGVFPKVLDGALNAWIEIYFGHLFAMLKLCEVDLSGGFEAALEQFRKMSLKPRIVYLFGIDNSYYYTFLFTWLSKRLDLPEMLPHSIHANFFLQLNNAKVSSSRNNVIWARDLRTTDTLEILRGNLTFSCPEFAPCNYQNSNLSIPAMDSNTYDSILKTASSEPFLALKKSVETISNPSVFTVESLMNVIEKWNGYASKMKESDIDGSSTLEVEAYLSKLVDHLCICRPAG